VIPSNRTLGILLLQPGQKLVREEDRRQRSAGDKSVSLLFYYLLLRCRGSLDLSARYPQEER